VHRQSARKVIITLKQYVSGLIEFLLDRAVETHKICKDAKFEVVKTIAESPTAATTFGNVTLLRFREFVLEGPFYVRAQTEVAIEGAS
jgi:26S proteasome non-ATPase regulatory subunit 5